jgi:hypothetical protein
MNVPVNVRRLDLSQEEPGTDALVQSANSFLEQFAWARVKGSPWVGDAIPGILGLFLVELEPSEVDIDQFIWVLVGDIPPAYISTQYASSPKEALECYIAEMRAWETAVRKGESTEGLIPVNGDPTEANAAVLSSRLLFLETRVLPDLE